MNFSKIPLSGFEPMIVNLPIEIKQFMESDPTPGKVFVAGGWVRHYLNKGTNKSEFLADLDLFFNNPEKLEACLDHLKKTGHLQEVFEAQNAITISPYKTSTPIQLIIRIFAETPVELLETFDYNVCQVSIHHDGNQWVMFRGELFSDKELIPVNQSNNLGLGRVKRASNFVNRGYTLNKVFSDKIMDSAMEDFIKRYNLVSKIPIVAPKFLNIDFNGYSEMYVLEKAMRKVCENSIINGDLSYKDINITQAIRIFNSGVFY